MPVREQHKRISEKWKEKIRERARRDQTHQREIHVLVYDIVFASENFALDSRFKRDQASISIHVLSNSMCIDWRVYV